MESQKKPITIYKIESINIFSQGKHLRQVTVQIDFEKFFRKCYITMLCKLSPIRRELRPKCRRDIFRQQNKADMRDGTVEEEKLNGIAVQMDWK